MKKAFYPIAWFTILSTMIIIIVVLYWLTAPYEVMTFYENHKNTIEPMEENTVQSGEYLPIRENYCKNLSYPANVSRTFIDGISYQIPMYVSNKPVGCYGKDKDSIEYVYIPKALPPGKFRIQTVYSFQVNPLRTVHFTLLSDQFTIIK